MNSHEPGLRRLRRSNELAITSSNALYDAYSCLVGWRTRRKKSPRLCWCGLLQRRRACAFALAARRRSLAGMMRHVVTMAAALATTVLGQSSGFTPEQRLADHLGLRRRMDTKFAEFVDKRHDGDGHGLRRGWRSVGACPREVTITDSYLADSNTCLRAFGNTVVLRNTTLRNCGAPCKVSGGCGWDRGSYIAVPSAQAATNFQAELLTLELSCNEDPSTALIHGENRDFAATLKVRGLRIVAPTACASISLESTASSSCLLASERLWYRHSVSRSSSASANARPSRLQQHSKPK